jgi:phage tail sheath protein FI
MAEYLTPGVYIEEVNTGNKPIEGVSTSTVGFLGIAERGPATATLITSYTDYARAFGLAGPVVLSLAVSSPRVTAAGAGYTDGGGNGNFPATIAGGTVAQGGAAATVEVTLTAGAVTAASLTRGGNYTVLPDSPATITGLAGGAGATIGFAAAPGQSRPAYLGYAVEGFFQNSGQRCFVQTVRSGAATAASWLAGGVINITAASAGSWGNRVAAKIEQASSIATGANVTAIKLTVMYWSPLPPPAHGGVVNVDPTSRAPSDLRSPDRRDPQITEVFDNLDADPSSPNFYVAQINGVSNLITVAQNAPGLPPVQHPAPLRLLSNGADGNALVLQDFTGNPIDQPGQKSGLDAFTEIEEISLLCCPDSYAIGNNDDINTPLIDQCEVLKNRFAILSSTSTQHVPFSISYNSQYAAFYYPWLNVIDPLTNQKVLIPPGGHVAGIYARSDDARGVQKDPANEVIQGIDSLQFILTDQQQALLNPIGINALRYFKGAGNLVWGGRTTSIDPDWKYINVRRLFIFIEQSILRATQWAVFEINDEPVWAQVRRSISDFLTRLWMDDMLQGATKDQAFFVRCDRTTMTQYDIDNGRLICVIGIAPVKPAEFVIFRIGQWAGGSSVTE